MIVNGREYNWEDIEITLAGVPIKGLTKIEYCKDGTKKITEGLSYIDFPFDKLYNLDHLRPISKRSYYRSIVHKRLPRKKKKWLSKQLWSTFQKRTIGKKYWSCIYNGDFEIN